MRVDLESGQPAANTPSPARNTYVVDPTSRKATPTAPNATRPVSRNSIPTGSNSRRPAKWFAIGAVVLLALCFGALGLNSLIQNLPTASKAISASSPVTAQPTISEISLKDGATLMYVPVGEFTMGSDDSPSSRTPVHTVTLDAFWIDQTEITGSGFI